jgi:hypothetical protein
MTDKADEFRAELCRLYGEDLVEESLAGRFSSVSRPSMAAEKPVAAKPHKKRRKGRGCSMSMMDAAKAAIPCLGELGKNGKRFTSINLGKALEDSGTKVPASWPSLILSKFLKGIKAVDKTKKPYGYALAGTLDVKTLEETKVRAKGRRRRKAKK